MKVMKKECVKRDLKVAQIMTERNILAKVNHPFVIKLYCSFQTENYLYLVKEFCPGGELFFHLCYHNKFDDMTAKFYFIETMLAIEYLHKNDIIYRDLKPENILLDIDGHIRITDFGLSRDDFALK